MSKQTDLINVTDAITVSGSNVGIGTSSPSTPVSVHSALPSGGAIAEFRSTGNVSSTLDIRADGTGDSRIWFDLNGATPFAIGVDNSDGDKFKISGSSQLGTNDRLTIDSSGNVGIGTTSPSAKLHVSDGGGAGLEVISQTSNDRTTLLSYDRSANTYQTLDTDSLDVHFNISGTEKIRIDASGNLLVGKTTTAVNTQGIQLGSNGRFYATSDGAESAVFNRKTSNGTVVDFRINNTTVGSIFSGHGSTQVGIGTNTTGITFNPSTRSMMPANPSSTNPQLDATLDIGFPSVRWKDLYLSGGVYLGGTGSANKLDDYEEGTWNPAIYYQNSDDQTNSTNVTQVGRYRKVGNLVVASFYLVWSTSDARAVDNIGIKNFPFPPQNINVEFRSTGQVICSDTSLSSSQSGIMIYLPNNNTTAIFSLANTGSGNLGAAFGNNNNMKVRATISYLTNT